MRIFQHKLFYQWAKDKKLTNKIIWKAVKEMEQGLYEATLGSGLYKKRVAVPGKGKRSSYRTLVAFKKTDKAFFIYGFAKNVRTDINEKEQRIYRQLAKEYFSMDESTIQKMIKNGKLFEVTYNEEKLT